MLKLQDTVP